MLHEDAIDKRDFWHLNNLHHLTKVPLECAQCHTTAAQLYTPAGMAVRAEFVHCKACLAPCSGVGTAPVGRFFATFDKWPYVIVPHWAPIK